MSTPRLLFVITLLLAPGVASAGGLHLRGAIGPGYATGTHDTDGASASGGGVAINTEIAIGTMLRPGLAVGGGTFPMVVPAPAYDGADAGGHHLSATGPFVDWYRRPPRGLHAQAALLFVAGFHESENGHDSAVGVGVGAMAGVGYDFALSGRWSIGPLARVTYYHWSGGDFTLDLATPALLVAVTRH